MLYSVLSSFSPYPLQIVDGQQVLSIPSNSGLGKFSTVSSEWGLYLIMSVLMEYIAVIIYVVVGIITPLGKDAPPDYAKGEGSSESYMMGGSQQQQYQPQQYWQR